MVGTVTDKRLHLAFNKLLKKLEVLERVEVASHIRDQQSKVVLCIMCSRGAACSSKSAGKTRRHWFCVSKVPDMP
jgi:hypothetical protein